VKPNYGAITGAPPLKKAPVLARIEKSGKGYTLY